jgi:hypothetical protein
MRYNGNIMMSGDGMKVRTQVYLEPEQHRWLRGEARALNVSMTELLRNIVAEHMHGRHPFPSREAFMSIVGLGESGPDDVAEEHDRYLVEVIADEHLH